MVFFSFIVVRHGETTANADSVIQGHSHYELNDRGRRQAAALGTAFANSRQQFTHVFTSDLSRAKETAEIILKQSKNEPSKLRTDKRLRERCYGVLEGKSSGLLKESAVKASQNVYEFTPEGGETRKELYDRVVLFFKNMCELLSAEFPDGGSRSMSPLQTPNPIQLPIRNPSSRKVSRSNNLKSWPEEIAQMSHAAFYLGDDDNTLVTSNRTSVEEDKSEGKGEGEREREGERMSMEEEEGRGFCSRSTDSGFDQELQQLTVDVQQVSPSSSLTSAVNSRCLHSPSPLSPHGIGSQSTLRKFSMQSIASDDSCFPELDAQILVVTHGGTIRELLRYFNDELACLIPGGKAAALRTCPNTSVSTFMITLFRENQEHEDSVSVTCVDIHSKEHLVGTEFMETTLAC